MPILQGVRALLTRPLHVASLLLTKKGGSDVYITQRGKERVIWPVRCRADELYRNHWRMPWATYIGHALQNGEDTKAHLAMLEEMDFTVTWLDPNGMPISAPSLSL